ncbi:MAG: acyl--CoA ligase, partial [Spirochaetaceae bacterium]|nr:acyl--CoA ligase [Spirochaetaceae bacterium]
MAKKEKTLPWAFLDEFRGKSFTGEWPTLPEMFSITVSRYPNNSCFTDFEPEKVTLTYTEVLANVKKLSNWILAQGLKKGDRVAVSGKNSPEWATVYLATLFAGGIIVPIDYGLHDREVSNLLNAAKPNLFFVDEEKFGYFSENPQGTKVYSLSKKHPELYAYNLSDEKEYTAELPTEDDVAAILFTSGTTGTPKGVMLTHKNLVSDCYIAQTNLTVYSTDVFYALLPIHHSYTMLAVFIETISTGAEVVFGKSMAVSRMLKELREGKITM